MTATAKTAEATTDRPDLKQLHDSLVQSYNPVNAQERMLVTQIAQSWLRLRQACDLESRYFQNRDMAEVVATKLDEFKAITRYVTDCERAWRHATLNLEKSQRRRQKPAQASAGALQAAQPPQRLAPQPPAPPAAVPPNPPAFRVAHAVRE